MGRRTYRDTMTPDEIVRRKVKSASTTTRTSGFKISGLRVYQPVSETWLIRKHIRRNRLLSEEDTSFRKLLALFLFDGVKYRLDLVRPFLEKLQSLHDALEKCRQFDFMASSVLLIYEGDSSVKPKIDVRLIDFDHTIVREDSSPICDIAGFKWGLNNLMAHLRKILYWLSNRKNTTYCFKSIDKSNNKDKPLRRYSTSQLHSKIPLYLHKTKYLSQAYDDY